MKGVVLAGGLGTRLSPLTDVTNKHLLPIYDRPMLYYPLQMLADAGIKDVLVVVGGKSTGEVLRLLKNGKQFGLSHLYYTYQDGEGGIADAISLASKFVSGCEQFVVALGDNLYEYGLGDALGEWDAAGARAHVLLAQVPDPKAFGCPVIQNGIGGRAKIVYVEEKPENPKSEFAVTGVYGLDYHAFDYIAEIEPSARHELEVTDLLNKYAGANQLSYSIVQGWWADAGGSVSGLLDATELVRTLGANRKKKKEIGV